MLWHSPVPKTKSSADSCCKMRHIPSTYSGAYPQSRDASRFPRYNLSCRPARIFATARVILRVTNVSPRRGLSWLNRMPLQAYRPGLAVIDGHPVAVYLGCAIRTTRMELGLLVLRRWSRSKHFRGTRLIETSLDATVPNGIQYARCP